MWSGWRTTATASQAIPSRCLDTVACFPSPSSGPPGVPRHRRIASSTTLDRSRAVVLVAAPALAVVSARRARRDASSAPHDKPSLAPSAPTRFANRFPTRKRLRCTPDRAPGVAEYQANPVPRASDRRFMVAANARSGAAGGGDYPRRSPPSQRLLPSCDAVRSPLNASPRACSEPICRGAPDSHSPVPALESETRAVDPPVCDGDPE